MSATRESLLRELERLLEVHQDEVRRLGLRIVIDRVAKHRDTWEVPVIVGQANGSATDLTELIRTIRRSLENKMNESVSVMLDSAEAV